MHSRANQCLCPSQRALDMRCTYFESVLCKVSPSFVLMCVIATTVISSCKIGGVGWRIVIVAGLQIRNDRVKQMRGKSSLLHLNILNAPLGFLLHLLWGPHCTAVGGYSSLRGTFSRRRLWWQAATLKDTYTQTPSHVSIFSRHPAENADWSFRGTGNVLPPQAALLEDSTR